MALTRSFKETVRARVQRDPAFRGELFKEGIRCFLSGDVDTGKIILRDYINATIGFEELAGFTGTPAKSLMRMFGPTGNPSAGNLFPVISQLQDHTGVRLEIRSEVVEDWAQGDARPEPAAAPIDFEAKGKTQQN